MVKISDLSVLSRPNLSADDKIEILDVSDHSMAPTGTNKAITAGNLIGELLNAVPGTIVANAAVVANSSGDIAPGVGQSDLTTLDVTHGTWTADKALIVNSNGEIHGINADQFAALDTTPGSWTAGKALVVGSDGKLNTVSSTQFQALNVAAGNITPGKAIVVNDFGSASSSTVAINTGTPGSIEIIAGGTSVVIDGDSVTISDGTSSITITKSSFTANASSLSVILQGLPTSDSGLSNYRLWVDELGYVRMKLPSS